MQEIFTIGGGEFIVNVLNAVAAWTGGGGFRSLIQVVFVMGLIYALLVVAVSLNWKAWFNWFLGATAIYGVMIVPTTSVKVTDSINPGLAPAVVANVPIGLASIASVTSQM
ncbi:MAG: conjugal transfer protein TraG N-terminal domain-containing protein, partial [Alteraurantiacibacter sp.]